MQTIENPPTNSATELVEIAQFLHQWQNEQTPKLADTAMLRRYPQIGSVKTFDKLRNGDTSSLDLSDGEWLREYREAKSQVEIEALGRGDDPIYTDLAPAKTVAVRIKELVAGKGTDRILIVQGGTGSGKTKALECAHALIPQSLLATGDIMWSISLSAMLGDLCMVLGAVLEKEREDFMRRTSSSYRAALLKQALGKRKLVLLVDECHHLSADGIDFIKGLVNSFPGLYVVLAGMDTLWDRLTSGRWEQAKQIIYNRGMATFTLAPPDATDATNFLTRRVPGFNVAPTTDIFAELLTDAKQYGAFAYLRRVSRKLLKQKGDLDSDALKQALQQARKDIRTSRSKA